jgi:hypothetical protein
MDPYDRPLADRDVRVGIMLADGGRDEKHTRSDATGVARFEDLPVDGEHAYRVTMEVGRARYSSTPFRLDPEHGQHVRAIAIPTTDDDASVLQVTGQIFLELKPERVQVLHQVQLLNFGSETYVFPRGGASVSLPEGFLAFQAQQSMGDQRFVPNDHGFKLEGSLPPGIATLAYTYDLPLDGEEIKVEESIPFRTVRFRVITDAAEGLRLSVRGFPPAERVEGQGNPLLVTEIARVPEDPPLPRISATLSGIPGPGPIRWIAVFVALPLLAIGIWLTTRGKNTTARSAATREAILDEVAQLEKRYAAGEVGPKYHDRRRAELVDELASLLRAEQGSAT